MSEKRKIVLQEILDMLEEGKDRKEINEFYGLNPREAKALWANPRLKGVKKAKYSIGFELVEETIPEGIVTSPPPFYGDEHDTSM